MPKSVTPPPAAPSSVGQMSSRLLARADVLRISQFAKANKRIDRLVVGLMGVEIVTTALVAAFAPTDSARRLGATLLVRLAVGLGLGAVLLAAPLVAFNSRRLAPSRRHVFAVAQLLWTGVLIQLAGRESQILVFASLGVLGVFREPNVLVTGTLVTLLDQLVRGMFFDVAVQGVEMAAWSKFLLQSLWLLIEDAILLAGTVRHLADVEELGLKVAELEMVQESTQERYHETSRELELARERYRLLVENSRTVPIQVEAETWNVAFVAPQVRQLLGAAPSDWLQPGFMLARMHPEDQEDARARLRRPVNLQMESDVEFRLRREDGSWTWLRLIVNITSGGVVHGVLLDVTQRRQLELELSQAQKLESVGRLASGIAHELNTPIQFVGDSIHFIRDAFADTLKLLEQYRLISGKPALSAQDKAQLAESEESADLVYLTENVPKALDRSVDGLARVASIVRSMKEFAHPDQRQKASADLNHALQSTLIIARNEYKYVADVESDLGELPPVFCHVNELNQVFLNLLVNASHAIEDVVGKSGARGTIRVKTRREGDEVIVSIGDSGAGIPESIRTQIFDPFFTTKGVGKGTGQGLSIARSVVVDKHLGKLSFESEVGTGTTFFIRLPINAPAKTGPSAAAA